MALDFSKSLGKQQQAGSGGPAQQQSGAPMLDFSNSLTPILKERQQQEAAERERILHPDLKGRLRFPSQGDPPRKRPERSWFQREEDYQGALEHWQSEQKREAKIYERALGSLGAPPQEAAPAAQRSSSSPAPRKRFAGSK